MSVNAERELIKDLFYQACNLPEDERHDFLINECQSRTDLLEELLSLLASHKKSCSFFNDLTQDILGIVVDDSDAEQATNPDPYNIINSNINDFFVQSKVADGGMGIIYKANDNRLNRTVILKFLPPHLNNDPVTIKRFKREAVTASNIDHVNVGTIYSVERTDAGLTFISMAYYEGQTLSSKLENYQLSLNETLDIISQLIAGLEAAHKKNIVHRDIKPANIIILPDGVIKILDFGLAKVSDQQSTATGLRMGTLSYMSPEHIRGESLDLKSDVWSLGVVFYELLSGRRPFTGISDQSLMHSVLNDKLDFSNIDAPLEVKKLISQCLRRNSKYRYQSMKLVSAALKNARQDLSRKAHSYVPKLIENILLVNNPIRLALFVACLVAVPTVAIYYSLTVESEIQDRVKLPSNKSVAIYAQQQDLSNFQLGIVKNISQTLLSVSRDKKNILVVPYEKVKTYNAINPAQALATFGVNLILDLNLTELDNKQIINLSLIDSKTLIAIDTIRVVQPTDNSASLQDSLNSAVVRIFEVENAIPIRKKLASIGTTNPLAFEAYTNAQGLLSRVNFKDNTERAIRFLQTSLANDSNFYAAKASMADSYWLLYIDSKNIEYARKSEKLYEALLLDRPDDINSYLSLAKLHSILGRHGTALASYQIALSFDQNNADILEGIASVYEKTGKPKLAEEFYLKGISVNINRWDGYNSLGAFYLRQGRYSEAIVPFNKVIQAAPGNAWGYANLGTTNWYLGKIERAIEYYTQSLALQEDYVLYKNLGTLLFYQKEYLQATKWYIKATKMNDNDHTLFASLGGAYHYAGQSEALVNSAFRKAIDLANTKLAVLPDDINIILSLASYNAWAGEIELSEKYLSEIKDSSQLTVQHSYQISVIYQILGKTKQALNWIERTLSNGYPKEHLLQSPEISELNDLAEFKKILEKY